MTTRSEVLPAAAGADVEAARREIRDRGLGARVGRLSGVPSLLRLRYADVEYTVVPDELRDVLDWLASGGEGALPGGEHRERRWGPEYRWSRRANDVLRQMMIGRAA
jgi:hypothetical protein